MAYFFHVILFFLLLAEWMRSLDPHMASVLFCRTLLREHSQEKPLRFHLDLKDSPVDQERSILSFYKSKGVNWAAPLKCILEGNSYHIYVYCSQVLPFYFTFVAAFFNMYLQIICILFYLCFIGDTAIGDGVNRHLLSMTIEKLRTGFSLNFGICSIITIFM